MNRYLDIIPTPKFMEYTEGESFFVRSVSVTGESAAPLDTALSLLSKECSFEYSKDDELRIFVGESALSSISLSEEELSVFNERFAKDQGYILKRDSGITYIYAMSVLGAAYGVLTVLQLIGKNFSQLLIRDWPDFGGRGVKWTLWAETGIWSYDFGDGAEKIKERFKRKLDMLFKYKIKSVYADGFGFDPDRFPEYAEIMRFLNDEAEKRGMRVSTGGYLMSYGMTAHLNSYQGKDFLNRTSYPDGEIYECIGTYDAYRIRSNGEVDRSARLTEVRARTRGTCLSNDALLEEKMKEITEYVRRTHSGHLSLHNMDAHEIHPELWAARCPMCKKRFPNDDLFAKDGAAGAFAEYFDKIMERIYEIEDGDFKASERTSVSVAAPGYMYSDWTSDEDFETGIKFWSKVTEYMKNRRNFSTGFREQFFYHGKDIPRAEGVKGRMFTSVGVGSFTGADGFYDDKLFAVAACLNYIMKGFDGMTVHNGNAFQEPLAVFDAEYLWNSENSGFYDPPRPKNQEEYVALRDSMIKSLYRPDEIYGDGGFIDVICEKLYGKKIGKSIARVYKISGKNGEPPIPSASSVDIYTNYSKVVYPMRWDTEMSREEIAEKTERFLECNKATRGAKDALKEAFSLGVEDEDARYDLQWLLSCFEVGDRLTYGLYRYMLVYADIDRAFRENKDFSDELKAEIIKVKELGSELLEYVRSLDFKAIDKFGGSSVRREEMADFIEYNAALMLSSIEQNKRIPDGRRPERTRDWW